MLRLNLPIREKEARKKMNHEGTQRRTKEKEEGIFSVFVHLVRL
jgi:hypothetical protein